MNELENFPCLLRSGAHGGDKRREEEKEDKERKKGKKKRIEAADHQKAEFLIRWTDSR